MSKDDQLARDLDTLHRRVGALAPNPDDSPSRESGVTAEVFQEFQTTLEELRVAEEELRQQNEELIATRQLIENERQRYQELFEFAPDAYLVTDMAGKIQEANRAAGSLLNVPQEFLVGKPLFLYIAPTDRSSFTVQLAHVHQGDPRQEWQMHLCPRREQPLDALLTVTVVRDRHLQPVGLRWLLRNVSGHKQAERLAAIGQMMAGLAHEGRNALQRSQACLERLAWKLQNQPEHLDLVVRAQKAQDDLTRLFNDVRDYAASMQLERRPCHLADLWREAWTKLAPLRQGRDVWLREEVGECDLVCDVDPFRLEQIFRNILDNALAACADPVQIEIRCTEATWKDQPALQIAVRDNGPGLNDEQKQKIFEPFYTTKTKGTGLGMAIARRLVEAHGGRIAVGKGPGAEILITLPRRQE